MGSATTGRPSVPAFKVSITTLSLLARTSSSPLRPSTGSSTKYNLIPAEAKCPSLLSSASRSWGRSRFSSSMRMSMSWMTRNRRPQGKLWMARIFGGRLWYLSLSDARSQVKTTQTLQCTHVGNAVLR
ncbi:hypothetical protein FA13DRAFT_1749598 [Coprinellus micaceus]|uniref:Uncharacterized protein n=1 Tax=Coprinellus micaceus TaxID=71717 RepID=A0A4Y7RIY0_COPMI|nr:hypothetical protein FA13DRAFT_1749598 [Coprinellus micaceus]